MIRDLGLAGGVECGLRFLFYLKLYWTRTLEELLKIIWGVDINFWGAHAIFLYTLGYLKNFGGAPPPPPKKNFKNVVKNTTSYANTTQGGEVEL